MHALSYTFYPTSDDASEFLASYLSPYLGDLHKNGQITGEWLVTQKSSSLVLACMTPCPDSLHARYANRVVRESCKSLVSQSRRAPRAHYVGELLDYESECKCDSPPGYVLFTTCIRVEPPVLCARCGGYVPLYKLPFYGGDEEHYTIQEWERTYKACDTLWMNSSFGERFGRRHMGDARSPLSSEGLDICRDIGEKLGRPFYYYLDVHEGKRQPACPLCYRPWQSDSVIAHRFGLACHECGLATYDPRNV